jgi:uncharacterized protein with von Willebrand factor type A (vWA) domain
MSADALVLAAVALGRALRAAGLPATPARAAMCAAGAGLLGHGTRDELYWAARLAFVSTRDQLPVFDAVFAAVVDGVRDDADRGDPAAPPPAGRRGARPPAGRRDARAPSGDPSAARAGGGRAAGDASPVPVGVGAGDQERLRHTRLDELDDAELALVAHLVRRLAVATPARRRRRSRPSRRGGHLDVRATLRRSHRTGGDPVERLHRRRRERPRPLVALLDVSGSMAPYARAYLLLLEGAARGARAECFVFATRLTRVTRALRDGRAPLALPRAGAAAPDWAGGTRIGAALRTFNDHHGRRGMARDAVVVICSDGWERGDAALLGRELERLARLAYRVVWVNPRVSAAGFAPRTAGMAAALPHVHELVSGHSIAALDAVVAAIGRPRSEPPPVPPAHATGPRPRAAAAPGGWAGATPATPAQLPSAAPPPPGSGRLAPPPFG